MKDGLRDLLEAKALIMTRDPARMEQELIEVYQVRSVKFGDDEPFFASANRLSLPATQLHYCRYDVPSEIAFADMKGYRMMFQLTGAGELDVGGQDFAVNGNRTAILPPDSNFTARYGAGYSHLVLQLSERALARHVELLTGRDMPERLDVASLTSLDVRAFARLRSITIALAAQLSDPIAAISPVTPQLEQALMTAFLYENHKDVFEPKSPTPDRPTIRRLEDYIQTHWREPLLVETIAQACGVSVRTVFLGFRQAHGVTPMQYLRRVRLDNARSALLGGMPEAGVLEIAEACGFTSFGHFAHRYRERHGELPSETLKRAGGP